MEIIFFDSVNIFLGAAAIPGEEFVLTELGPEYVMVDEYSSSNGGIRISRFDYLRQDDAKNFILSKSNYMQAFDRDELRVLHLQTSLHPLNKA